MGEVRLKICSLLNEAENLINDKDDFLSKMDQIDALIKADLSLKHGLVFTALTNGYRLILGSGNSDSLKEMIARDAACFRTHTTVSGIAACLTAK